MPLIHQETKAWRIVVDDPRFDLSVGDVVECTRYWLDPDKLTVWKDGEPAHNIYREQARPA